jgi:hypothetical protein
MEPREAAAMFGVKARTLRRWHQMGLISARMTMGGKRRYWLSELTALAAELDRDVNAAKNILAAGQADRRNASGGSVRPGRKDHACPPYHRAAPAARTVTRRAASPTRRSCWP